MMRSLIALLFRCRHTQRTWVFTDTAGLYQRCCACGARLRPNVDLKPNARVLVRIEETKQKQTA